MDSGITELPVSALAAPVFFFLKDDQGNLLFLGVKLHLGIPAATGANHLSAPLKVAKELFALGTSNFGHSNTSST